MNLAEFKYTKNGGRSSREIAQAKVCQKFCIDIPNTILIRSMGCDVVGYASILFFMIQGTPLIHKLTTELFKWIDKTAAMDDKYTNVCLLENYNYFFYTLRSSMLTAIQQYVKKSKYIYKKNKKKYVKWKLEYEIKDLMAMMNNLENTMALYEVTEVHVMLIFSFFDFFKYGQCY